MKGFKYVGNEQQLRDRGFKVQIDISGHTMIRFAWRDFKHIDESIVILLEINDINQRWKENHIRVLYNHAKHHRQIKHEIQDLIDDELTKVEEMKEW